MGPEMSIHGTSIAGLPFLSLSWVCEAGMAWAGKNVMCNEVFYVQIMTVYYLWLLGIRKCQFMVQISLPRLSSLSTGVCDMGKLCGVRIVSYAMCIYFYLILMVANLQILVEVGNIAR